jgi:hypothetical protein
MPRERPTRPMPTMADVCQAIEEHRIRATIRDGMYVVRQADLRRLAKRAARPSAIESLASRRPAS